MKWGVAVVVRRVDLCAVFEEELHDIIVPVHGSVVKSCIGVAAHITDIDIDFWIR